MMNPSETLLALDIGNTHVVLGIFKGQELTITRRLSTQSTRTADEAGVLVKSLCSDSGVSPKEIDAVAISSVAPRIGMVYGHMAESHLGLKPLFIHGEIPNFENHCKPRKALGADRVCNAVAGFEKFGGPLLILDFGTAITIDVIDGSGAYMGGAIMPGLEKSAATLNQSTALLPEVRLSMPKDVIATTTDESIRVGLMKGTAFGLRGLLNEFRETLGDMNTKVIATGGVARVLIPHIPEVTAYEPNLVLDGIFKIYKRSKTW